MATYELMYILRPDLDEEGLGQTLTTIDGLIARAGATVTKVDKWGRRRLAYPIKGFNDGFYVVTLLEAEPEMPAEIYRLLRIQETVLRSLITRVEESRRAEE